MDPAMCSSGVESKKRKRESVQGAAGHTSTTTAVVSHGLEYVEDEDPLVMDALMWGNIQPDHWEMVFPELAKFTPEMDAVWSSLKEELVAQNIWDEHYCSIPPVEDASTDNDNDASADNDGDDSAGITASAWDGLYLPDWNIWSLEVKAEEVWNEIAVKEAWDTTVAGHWPLNNPV